MNYTTAHISEALGISRQAVSKRIKKEGWKFSRGKGRGGGRVFSLHQVPEDVREALLKWELLQGSQENLPAVIAEQSPALVQEASPIQDSALLTTKQRSIMCARLAFVREIERLTALGQPRGEVMASLSQMVDQGSLPPHLGAVVDMANDRAGGRRGISVRSLQRWAKAFAASGETALAPARPGRDLSIPAWAKEFLTIYQQPSNPTLADAYRQVFGLPHKPNPGAPSIWAVRRFVAKLSTPALLAGRKTGNAWLSIMPHKRRDTSNLWPTDVYTMDGTTFDAEIQHPQTGHPFKPEITLVLDVYTRRCVGMSVNLAESAIATLDALRMACLFGGIPAILYADNGSGYCNAMWTAEGTGLMSRLGIELRHSIPGRPQGKGLMERSIQTICVPAAKRLMSCMHKDMDQDAAKKVFKISRKALRLGGNALPTWAEFKKVFLDRVDEYNDTPHRGQGMPTITIDGKTRPMSPNEAWTAAQSRGFEPVLVPENMRDELFMPAEHRKVRNAKIQFMGGEYYHKDLAELHGEPVEVRFDVWNSAQVYVYSLEGVRICIAGLYDHSSPYFPPSQIEAADERRKKAQLKRLEAKAQRIVPGASIEWDQDPVPLHDAIGAGAIRESPVHSESPLLVDSEPSQPALAERKRPLFLSKDHHYRWLMENRDLCTDTDEDWLEHFVLTPDYADMADRYVFDGVGYEGRIIQVAMEN